MDTLITQDFLNELVNTRKSGVSGLMRVKNEEKTVRQSIESVIKVLDELVVIYHECVDNTLNILKEIASIYPKVMLYEYKQHVIPANSGQYIDGFNPAHSLANYYNFGLSKCTYNWFLKIDADQIYFEDELRNLINHRQPNKHYCMVGFNVLVDKNNNIGTGKLFEGNPLNGCHGDHFLTEIKKDSCFKMLKNNTGEYKQCEEYSHPEIEWSVFDFSIGGAYWYHVRYFKDFRDKELSLNFSLTPEDMQSVQKYINFNYLAQILKRDKISDDKIDRIIECFHKYKHKLNRNNFI